MKLEGQALQSIVNTIRAGPVTYAGGALDSGRVFEYDGKDKAVLMTDALWRELCLLGHWIVDAVILRWAALTERIAHRQGLSSGDVLPLLLAQPEPERATAHAREVYLAAGAGRCVWSGRELSQRTLAVDHVIPFALWGNNDLWNLVPSHTSVNGHKSDKLPTGELILERRDSIIESWRALRDAMPDAFDRQALALCGSRLPSGSTWHGHLFDRMRESVEVTALQRGVERWTTSTSTSGSQRA